MLPETEMDRGAIWKWRMSHPACLPRVVRGVVRSAWLWRLQGRPTDIPVVVRPGRLVADADGRGMITGFHFDASHMTRSVRIDDLWDRLSAIYPVERAA